MAVRTATSSTASVRFSRTRLWSGRIDCTLLFMICVLWRGAAAHLNDTLE
jgi:hypothetical protein